MRSAFRTEVARSIAHSLGRFVAIAAIAALGTGFYAGLRMTCPDMMSAADAYEDGTNLMDVRVVSTMGLTEADIEALRAVEGVKAVMPARETDVLATVADEQYPVRVHSLDDAAVRSEQTSEVVVSSDDADYVNRLSLAEGRWPEKAGECVISADCVVSGDVGLGDVVEATEGASSLDGVLATRSFTVVGTVHSSYYISSVGLGTTSVGSGTIEQYAYVPHDAFDAEYPYTEAFVTVSGARELAAGSDSYAAHVSETLARIEAIADAREQARHDELYHEAQLALDDARAAYERERSDAEDELAAASSAIDVAAAAVARSEADLASGQARYDAGVAELASQRASAQQQAESAAAELDGKQAELDALRAQLAAAGLPPAAIEAQTAPAQAAIDAGRAALVAEAAEAEARFAQAQTQLDAAAAQLQSGCAQLDRGRVQLEQGRADHAAARAEADARFAEAEADLAQAQVDIDAIERPSWLVMDRSKNYGVASFEADAERVDHIAQVFPLIFFLVAALVALTTMTRMVEEERVLIGTYKALGYSRSRITMKYIAYAALASTTGSVVGIAVLSLVLPTVIMNAYAIIYYVPHELVAIDAPLAVLSAGLGVGITLLATWAAVASTLREQPARLMLPRAPKAGKRILLERVRPVWGRLSFSWKVTCRNIFRYKKRFVMTIIGIAGCTALLLTGLGLSDSINDIIDKHFGELLGYNAIVRGDDDLTEQDAQAIDELIAVTGRSSASARAHTESLVAVDAGGADATVELVVPEDSAVFQGLWTVRERVGKKPLEIGAEGVVVSEKLATTLGIGVGDLISLSKPDEMGNATGDVRELEVTGVMENYVSNYVLVGRDAFASAFEREPSFTATYALVTTDEQARAAMSERARAIEGVKTLSFNDETIDTYRTMLRSVNMIVVVLVVAAAALAFIVLYNLTNINITERVREIATLKVLGFTSREVDQYIFRETMLLAVIGCAIGLALGVFLEGFVIVTAEVDQVMFGREIHAASFVAAFALTMAFSVAVMAFMRRKLAAVDMIESLKSNE